MTKRISIYRDQVWAGEGRINNDGEIVDCPAVLGTDQDASDETYELIHDAIEDDDDGGWKGSVQRPDAVYSWEIVDDTPVFTIQMVDENGVERDDTRADTPSPQEVKYACEAHWHRMPAYMPQGAYLRVDYSILDSDLELVSTGSVEIDIEPDHTHLIGQACGVRGCGHYNGMHKWVQSGADPDVSQCSRCGLRKTSYMDGKHRAVKYEMPNNWPKGELKDVDAGTVQ